MRMKCTIAEHQQRLLQLISITLGNMHGVNTRFYSLDLCHNKGKTMTEGTIARPSPLHLSINPYIHPSVHLSSSESSSSSSIYIYIYVVIFGPSTTYYKIIKIRQILALFVVSHYYYVPKAAMANLNHPESMGENPLNACRRPRGVYAMLPAYLNASLMRYAKLSIVVPLAHCYCCCRRVATDNNGQNRDKTDKTGTSDTRTRMRT